MAFYENLGFTGHPFNKTNADEERNLSEYFVPPPFFDAIIGDSAVPSPSLVLAPRGAGKTAQRIMVEKWAEEHQVLAITYDRFEFSKGQNLSDISLQYHIKNIIIRVLVSYLSYISEYPDVLKNCAPDTKRTLSIFIHSYLGEITGHEIQSILIELKSLPERFRDFWVKNVGLLESAVNFIMKKYELPSIDLPEVQHEQKKLSESYKYQLGVLQKLVLAIGFKSVYILIDKVDETEKTGTDPEKTYQLIQPMLKDLDFLGMPGFGIKLFIWDKIEPYFRVDARPDRINQYQLSWSRQSLGQILSKRLVAFSGNRVKSFREIVAGDVDYDIDSALSILANRSPRNLIRLCEKIFAVQSELNPESTNITSAAIDKGTIDYSLQVTIELYGEAVSKELQRVGRELFSINYLANNIFKTSHENTSRYKVQQWDKLGLIKKICTVHEGKQPVNFYYVTDPSVARLQQRAMSFKDFFINRWVECENCKADNLMEIGLFPEGDAPVCTSCNKALF
jgi:hypothetical protein